MKLPNSKIDQENRRGCFLMISVLLLVLVIVAIIGFSRHTKPQLNTVAVQPVR
jgi:hypothetical protein